MTQVVDAMVARTRPVWNGSVLSFADLGWREVALDDGWQACHTGPDGSYHASSGAPNVNTALFPDMAGLVDYAHSHGLTAGWYGNNCWCADHNNSVGNFMGDVKAFVDAGWDSYKLDSCGGGEERRGEESGDRGAAAPLHPLPPQVRAPWVDAATPFTRLTAARPAEQDIQLWYNLLNATAKKPVVIENCHNGPWLPEPPRKPGGPAWCPFHFYRSSLDIEATYGAIFGHNLATVQPLAAGGLSFPGCWAYPDMLEVGVTPGLHRNETGLTLAEARAHFGAWAIASSPLVLGLDVRSAAAVDAVWSILSNTEVIAVNQAWAGPAEGWVGPGIAWSGGRIAAAETNVTWAPCGWFPNCSAPSWEVWSKPLPGGASAVLLLNHDTTALPSVTLPWASVPALACAASGSCTVRDVYAHADLGPHTDGFTFTAVASHDSVFLTVQ